MSDVPRFNYLLVLPRIKVQNANAISSPLTHGFPAITAFTGLMWALERKACQNDIDISFNGIGVICHDHQEQVTDGYIKNFRLTRNPIIQRNQRKFIGKDGGAGVPAIVEEGRIHLEVSLVLAVDTDWDDTEKQKAQVLELTQLLQQMRIAGGTIVPQSRPWLRRYRPFVIDQSSPDAPAREQEFAKYRKRLLPGSVLVSRDDVIDKRLTEMRQHQEDATRLDAWLSLTRLNWHYQPEEVEGKGQWVHDRPKGSGWLVPIPVGYGSLSKLYEPGAVKQTRDNTTPFRFVESLYSMGEWLGVHRIKQAEQLLWYSDTDTEKGLYRCRNNYQSNNTTFNQVSQGA